VAASHSYPKAVRLRRRAEFLAVQREGRRRHSEHLVIIRRPAPGPCSRLGVTVSKRVGNAVVRSRDIAPPADVVVIAKPGADTLTYAQAASEFVRALELSAGE